MTLMESNAAVAIAKGYKGKPHAIVCDCIKGKGLSFMENNNAWHKDVRLMSSGRIAKKELGGEE